MARSAQSASASRAPTPMAVSSPAPSESSEDEEISATSEHPEGLGPSVSQRGSPAMPRQDSQLLDTAASDDSVTCQWDDCGIVFTHLPSLIEHIHKGM